MMLKSSVVFCLPVSSNVLVCPTNSPQHKGFQITIMEDKKKTEKIPNF